MFSVSYKDKISVIFFALPAVDLFEKEKDLIDIGVDSCDRLVSILSMSPSEP